MVFAVFVIVHLVGDLYGTPLLPSASLFAWAALCGYVLATGRDAPRLTRVALLAGLLVFAGLAAAEAAAAPEAGFQALSARQRTLDLAAAWSQGLREIAPWLVGCACLTAAALTVGTRPPGGAGRIVAIGSVTVAVGAAAQKLSDRADDVAEWLAYPVPLLPLTALAVAAFVAAGRLTARPLAMAGMGVVGLTALLLFDTALAGMWQWRAHDNSIAVVSVVLASTPDGGPHVWEAVAAAVPFLTAAAVTIGCLRRVARRDAA